MGHNNKAQVTVTDIGEKLKSAREKRSLTIGQVQKQTHIHATVIMALEEGRCDEILTPIYVKSFLNKYAHFLGLDARQITLDYSAIHPELPQQKLKLEKVDLRNSIDLLKIIHIARILLILVLVWFLMMFLGKKIMSSFKKPKFARTVQISGQRQPFINTTAAKRSKPASPTLTKAVSRTEPAETKTVMNLMLKVKQPVLVQLKKDGVLLFKTVLAAGTVETFTAYKSINIYIAKANAVDLILNGRYLGLPRKGVIRDLEITSKGIRIR